jgi:predicted urease superfamily metal-dependent hydrolase
MPLVVLESVSAASIVDAATNIVLGKRESLARGTHCTIALRTKRSTSNRMAEVDRRYQALETQIEAVFLVEHCCTPSWARRSLT